MQPIKVFHSHDMNKGNVSVGHLALVSLVVVTGQKNLENPIWKFEFSLQKKENASFNVVSK